MQCTLDMVVTPRTRAVLAGLAAVALAALTAAMPGCASDAPTTTDIADAGKRDSTAAPATSTAVPTTDASAGVDCPSGSAAEIEPDDTAAQATSLGRKLAMCGAISPGTDVDYSTFTTPAGKKLELFQAVVEGAMDFDLVVNGKTLKPTDVTSFEEGTYVVKAYTTDGKPGTYRYRIQFEL